MGKLALSVAFGDYDRTRPIVDGRVQIDGVDPICQLLSPEEMFFRAFRHQDFDVSELSLSSYCVTLTRDDPPYVAVPVFLSRTFRHTSIYIRNDRGISEPKDLKDRKIGIAEYQLTANVWARSLFADHGLEQSDIQWVIGGMNSPSRPEKLKLDLPDSVRIEPAPEGATLNQLLIDGEIDGFVGPRSPLCFDERHPKIGRLFADPVAAAEEYYNRTKIFPIMHLLGIRRSLVEEHPWLPSAMMKGFSQSKEMAEAALYDTSAPKVTMPFVEETLNAIRNQLGDNLWSYGFKENEHVLDAFLEAHHIQGLSSRRLQPEELFHPSTLESYSL